MITNWDEFTKDLLVETNRVREDPKSYIPYLEEQLKLFKDNVLHRPGEDPIQTVEGRAAFEEAIEYLRKASGVSALVHDARLSRACHDHIEDVGPKGVTSHESSDGRNVSDRIERYCEWDGVLCENIDFGCKNAVDVVITFIVDDGLRDRPHRRNLFNENLHYIGAAVGPHKDWETVSCIDYVAGVRDLGEESPDIKNFINDAVKRAEERKNNPKPLNPFQEDDLDAPDNTVSVKIVKTNKIIKGKQKKVTKKIYTLSDGTQHIVEIEDAATAA